MTIFYRGAGSQTSPSPTEQRLIPLLSAMPGAFYVIHSVKWTSRRGGSIGEADFLVAHPDYGLLVVECKGGIIRSQRRGQHLIWYSQDRGGRDHEIHDPWEQAERNRNNLLDWLRDHPRTKNLNYAAFPCAMLPDSRLPHDLRPDVPEEGTLDIRHCDTPDNLAKRFLSIFKFWKAHADGRNKSWSGTEATRGLIDLTIPQVKLTPRLADGFAQERQRIEELTKDQFRLLSFLRGQRRAAIIGGAGTGKTMLAMEKAIQLADEGMRVLFVCFNRNLSDWVRRTLTPGMDEPKSGAGITVATFHYLTRLAMQWSGIPPVPEEQLREKVADLALNAAERLRQAQAESQPAGEWLFDAIIVDEGQDFEDVWWIALQEMLVESQNGLLYIFFDRNQQIYRQLTDIPIAGEPYYLEENLRNTQQIHAAFTPYLIDGSRRSSCKGPDGRPMETVEYSVGKSGEPDAKPDFNAALGRLITRLVGTDGVSSSDIIIMTPRAKDKSTVKEGQQVGTFTLTWDMNAKAPNTVRVSTIYSFKGLETGVGIVVERDALPFDKDKASALMYVALSRARHHMVVMDAG